MKDAKHAKSYPLAARLMRVVSLTVAAACLTVSIGSVAPQARATSVSDLQQKLEQIQQQMEQHKADLADA